MTRAQLLREAQAEVKSFGARLKYDRNTEEYIVRWPNGATYHTDHLNDAVGTAKCEAERRGNMYNECLYQIARAACRFYVRRCPSAYDYWVDLFWTLTGERLVERAMH